MIDRDEVLNAQQVAERLGVAERTVRRWIERGWLKAARSGRNFQIASAEADALAARILPSAARASAVSDLQTRYEESRLALERLRGRYEELRSQFDAAIHTLEQERGRAIRLEMLLDRRAA